MSLLPAMLGLLALASAVALMLALVAGRAARRESGHGRERLRRIIASTDVGTWEWNLETGAVWLDERCAQIVGYSAAELGAATMATWHAFSHQEDGLRAEALLKQHVSGELPAYECEARLRHKDGHWVWVLARGEVSCRHADGRPRRMFGTHLDITERKRSEARLHESEGLLASILNTFSAEVAVLDRDGVIVAVNEPWQRFAEENGPEPGKAAPGTGVGSSYLAVCQEAPGTPAAAEAEPTLAGILAVLGGRLPCFNLEYPCHSPTEQRWFSLSVTALGGDAGGVMISHTNVTELHGAKLAMQAQSEQLDMNRQVLDAVSEAILVKGPGSKIVWANRAFLDYYGMGAEQLQGLIDAPFVAPDITQQYLRDDAQVFSSGQALDIADEPVVRFDGVTQRWHTVKSPIFDAKGRVIATVGVSRDITYRVRAEAALRNSQAFLDATGRIASVGGWTIELATQALHWTEQTCRIHEEEPGHCPTVEGAIRYYAPEARPVIERAVRDCIAHGTGFDLELPLITGKGRALWVRAMAEPEMVDGVAVRLRGALQDVTARCALEEELRRQSALLTSVLEHLPCGLSAYDDDLKFLASNSEHKRLLDLPDWLCDHPGAGLEDLLRYNAERGEYGRSGVEATVQGYLEAARGQRVAYRMERTRPNGVTLEVTGAPMSGGGFVLTHSDISDRKQADLALRKQTERLRLAADSAGIGVWEYDPIEARLEWDDLMYRMYGISRDTGLVPLDLWSAQLHPEDAPSVLAAFKAALEGQGVFNPEFRICRPDGEVRYIQAAAHVVRDAAGLPLRITGVNIDITLPQLSREALREAMQAAKSANVAKSQFLANMSHEIRTPMNAILGMLALLQQTTLTARQADYAGKTEGAARSLLRLLNSILDFSKIEAGKMTLDPQPFRLDELVHEVSSLMSASMGTKPLALRFEVAPETPLQLVGDAMRLQQILLNLVSNAIKFTAAGEVSLSMQAVRRDAAEVTLRIAVRDTGIGIAPEDQERVFSGFSQAEASTTRRFGGTGLGLAISQQLVALMGGELRLQSKLGKGSRFYFELTLPVATDVAAASSGLLPRSAAPVRPPRSTTGPWRLAGLRLLVVEDNADNQQIARELLEAEGAVVRLAHDGQQAVTAVAQAVPPFDLVLMDLQMPVMDGCTAARLIRQELGLQSLPIVAMTANVMAADREASREAGMNDHVGKPFDLDDLVRVLRRHAGRPQSETAAPPRVAPALPLAVMDAAAAAGVDIRPALHRLGERTDIYQRVLRDFVQDLDLMPGRLRSHLDHADLPAAARVLHSLKGLAATLGAGGLSGAAALGEQRMSALCVPPALPQTAGGAVAAACSAIEAAGPGLQTLLEALQSLPERGAEEGSAAAHHDTAAYEHDLRTLSAQLERGDMAATDSIEVLQRRHDRAGQGTLQPLADAVGALEFEQALQLCRQLLEEAAAA